MGHTKIKKKKLNFLDLLLLSEKHLWLVRQEVFVIRFKLEMLDKSGQQNIEIRVVVKGRATMGAILNAKY